ncbi:MAG TPA: ATP-binding protein [Stellaceae bacterium]|nr:ATP-binding protein [Stellaceae bacterium]
MAANIVKFPVRRRVLLRARHVRAQQQRRTPRVETHLRDAQSLALLGSWEVDLGTGGTFVSDEMRRIFGWAAQDAPDLARVLDVVHPDDRTRVDEWLCRNAAARPPRAGCFFRIVRGDGTLATLFGRSALRAPRNGSEPRLCGTVQDVTEQVATERAINEAAHLYHDIFEHCAWGVFQTTADGRYLTANPALARIYGYDGPAELLARLTDIGGQLYLDPGRRDEFVSAMRARGVVEGFESQVYRRDGSVIWIAETCREVRTSTGRLLYYEGTVRDVSERKRNEAALRRATAAADAANRTIQTINQDLERRVEARTAELKAVQHELLRKERLSTLGKLTATVAHELRNPLSAIRNSLHVARAAVAEPALDRPLGRIERSIRRCDRILCDLLDYAHTRRLDRRAIKLDAWLGNCLDDYRHPDAIVIERHFGAGETLVRLDGERFVRAIDNVLDNAVQSLEECGDAAVRRITVATTVAERVTIVIADTGPGIPPDILPNVFDPLFSTKSFGTGLGLPTVKQIVELHDGTVDLTSTPGRGTEIRITLPRAQR